MLIRLKCPPPLKRQNLTETRRKYAEHHLALGPFVTRKMSEKSVAQLPDSALMLLQAEDLVWVGAQRPAYSLWYKRFSPTSLKSYVIPPLLQLFRKSRIQSSLSFAHSLTHSLITYTELPSAWT